MIVAVAAILITAVFPAAAWADYSPGELLVRLKQPPRARTLDQVQQTGSAAVDRVIDTGEATATLPLSAFVRRFPETEAVVLLRFPAALSMDSLETELIKDPAVEWVSRNHLYRPNTLDEPQSASDEFPNDPFWETQWWLRKVSIPEAWQMTAGDSTVLIGIIDTGIDYLHPDLRDNIWINRGDADSNGIDDDGNGFIDDRIGWDFVDAPTLPSQGGDDLIRDNDPMDAYGHGTIVAGQLVAKIHNGICIAGMVYDSRIVCLRAGNSGGYLEEDDVAAALLYAAQMGVDIVNMSFGDEAASPLLRETTQLAFTAGTVLVASAGNDGKPEPHFPSDYPGVISVGATDRYDRRASFSNYGPGVDVMAPGTEISSTLQHESCSAEGLQGTSFAAPIVCAVAAMMLSQNPDLAPDDIRQILMTTADDIQFGLGSVGWDAQTTHGRVNALRAVQQARFGSDVVARIHNPQNESGVLADFAVSGESWGAAFSHCELSYGIGENPDSWVRTSSLGERVYGDTLGWIPIPEQDTVITVRLAAYGFGGIQAMDHIRIYIQRTPPQFRSMKITRMLDGPTYGDLVVIESDQLTRASLILTNSGGDSVREDFGYVNTNHTALLSQTAHPGAWTARIRLENVSGLATVSDAFEFVINDPPFTSNLWTRTSTRLPHGSFSGFTTDYNCNGRPEIWMAPLVGGSYLASIEVWEWSGTDFSQIVQTDSQYVYIPQAAGDADGDGLLEVMWRRGTRTLIWEQEAPCSAPNQLVYQDTINAVAVGFMDWDTTDGIREIILRRYVGPGQFENPRYQIFSVAPDYALTLRATIPNETAGSNGTGPPKLLIGDLDVDQKMDFIYTDLDADSSDLIFCERSGSDVVQLWTIPLPFDEGSAFLDVGDLDGDGRDELVAGCRSTAGGSTESQIRGRHWRYYILENTGDNAFALADSVFILGSEKTGDHPASVTCADVDADGRAEILISAYPDFYIIKHNPAIGRYQASWYYRPSESYTILAGDWNGNAINEFLYSDGNVFLRGEMASTAGQRPDPPLNVSGEPLGPTAVYLEWNPSSDADSYAVYRAADDMIFERIAVSNDTFIVISNAPSDVARTYTVTSLRATYPVPESVYSNFVSLIANAAPSVSDTAEFIEPKTVSLRFNEPMGASALWQWKYRLEDGRMPDAVTSGENGRVLFLFFGDGFAQGWHLLTIADIRDAQGSLLPTDETHVVFQIGRVVLATPHIISHSIVGGAVSERVEIIFSHPMSESATEVANYRMEAPFRALSVRSLTSDLSHVEVSLDPAHPVGATGYPARLQIRNLSDARGVPLDTTAGRADLLFVGKALTIADAYVYPNPYRGIGAAGDVGVMFAALPSQATIRIFTLDGKLVRKIEHRSEAGASRWDLTNENGDLVASGVYLFTIHGGGEMTRGKLAVMR